MVAWTAERGVSITRLLAFPAALLIAALPVRAEFITVASTTSTENSGLFGHILPLFEAETGIEVRVLSQGTGQALETARRGDADVVLVHARAAEETFVAEGWGLARHEVMANDFVLVGPGDDPAELARAADAGCAMRAIARAGEAGLLRFASRGDDSGTHHAELALWDAAGVALAGAGWYLETGSGMGATLNFAAEASAHVLTDRGTWLSFGNRGALAILIEGDPALFNPYGAILVNPARHPHVKAEAGQAFIDWLLSDHGQAAIEGFTVGGQTPFFGRVAQAETEQAAQGGTASSVAGRAGLPGAGRCEKP